MNPLLTLALAGMMAVIVCDQVTIHRYKRACKGYEKAIEIYQVAVSNQISTIDFVLGKLEELK
jgi:hypothetical protein